MTRSKNSAELELKDKEEGQIKLEEDSHIFSSTRQIWRNILVISLAYMLVSMALNSLQFLQSSLFREEGMGTIVLAVVYGSCVLSTLFVSTPTVNFFGCKGSLAIGMASYLCYTVAHFYARWYLFIPAAILIGIGGAPMWAAQGQYLNTAAHNYAVKKGISNDAATSLFFGAFYLFYQLALVGGMVVSSQILSPSEGNNFLITSLSPQQLELCGYNFDPRIQHSGNNSNLERLPDYKIFMLAGVYTGCLCLAVGSILIFLQQLPTEAGKILKFSHKSNGIRALVATVLQLRDYRQALLIPISTYNGLQHAFMFGDYTQAFITCSLGTWWIGYVIICYAVMDACCSLLFGKLVNYVGRIPFFVLGACVNGSLLITFLRFTITQEQIYIYFMFAGLWGVADGVWQTQISALYGVIFKENGKAAFSNMRLWKSVGFAIAFAYQSRLIFFIKAYILLAVLLVSMAGYGVVEFTEYKRKNKTSSS